MTKWLPSYLTTAITISDSPDDSSKICENSVKFSNATVQSVLQRTIVKCTRYSS